MATSTPPVVKAPSPDPSLVWIRALEQCESGGRAKIKVLDSNDKYSYGILQFQMSTWLAFGKPFGATTTNIYSASLQEQVARSMLDDGLAYHWKTCAAKVVKKIGAYPSGEGG